MNSKGLGGILQYNFSMYGYERAPTSNYSGCYFRPCGASGRGQVKTPHLVDAAEMAVL